MTLATTTEEETGALPLFQNMNMDELKVVAETISILVRALDGRPIEPDDVIRQLINLKDIKERSRFPTYPLLARNVYLRLIAKRHPEEAKFCMLWADLEAKALIAYKGEGRKEAVEMTKNPQPVGGETQNVYTGTTQAPQVPKKSRFWNRGKQDQGEFKNQ